MAENSACYYNTPRTSGRSFSTPPLRHLDPDVEVGLIDNVNQVIWSTQSTRIGHKMRRRISRTNQAPDIG